MKQIVLFLIFVCSKSYIVNSFNGIKNAENKQKILQNHWPLRGDVNDRINNANLFNGVNTQSTRDRFNNVNSATRFNFGYLNVPEGVYFSNEFTITVWIKLLSENNNNWGRILDFGNGDPLDNIVLGYSKENTRRPFLHVYNHKKIIISLELDMPLEINEWKHVAFSVSKTKISGYIDGLLINDIKNVNENLPRSILRKFNYIGKSNWPSDSLANVEMSDIKLFNVSLSKSQISNEMSTKYTNRTSSVSYIDVDYVNYVKDLLLVAKNYQIDSEPLECTDLDPQKNYYFRFAENLLIKFCDLCPKLPVDKLRGIYLNAEFFEYYQYMNYGDCVDNCFNNKLCVALSYDYREKTCYLFNSTESDFVKIRHVDTLIILQPNGLIKDFIFYRNTKLNGIVKNTFKINTFLDCLSTCENDFNCECVTYEFSTNNCKLFASVNLVNSVNYVVNHVSSFHLNAIHKNDRYSKWRFSKYQDFVDLSDESNDKINIQKLKNTREYGYMENAGCLLQPLSGCELTIDGKLSKMQKCYYPENTDSSTKSNLPICKDSIYKKYEKLKINSIILENCFKECLYGSKSNDCMFVDYLKLSDSCLTLNYKEAVNNWDLLNADRYVLKTPINRNRIEFQFTSYKQLTIIDRFQSESIHIRNIRNFDECLNSCLSSNNCLKASFNFKLNYCYHGGNAVGLKYDKDSYLYIKAPKVNVEMIGYDRLIELAVDGPIINTKTFICDPKNGCDNTLINKCLRFCLSNKYCEIVSILYTFTRKDRIIEFQCQLYNTANGTKFIESNLNSDVFIRKLVNFNLKQNDLDKLNSFQDYSLCHRQSKGQTQSTLQIMPSSTENTKNFTSIAKQRRKRFLGSVFNFFKEAIIDPVVKTGEQLFESGKKLIQGDFKGAGEALLEIPIVQDVKNTIETGIELGKNIAKGDWEAVKENALDFGLNAVSLAPGAGKGVGKLGAKAKNVFKRSNKADDVARSQKATNQGISNKSSKKKDKDKDKDKTDNNIEKCKSKSKRATANINPTNKKRPRPCDDDEGECKILGSIAQSKSHTCKKTETGRTCSLTCNPGYHESDLRPKCINAANRPTWSPKPECIVESCGIEYPNGIFKFPVNLKQKLDVFGSIDIDTTLYYVVFDSKRKLPVYTATFVDSITFSAPKPKRIDGFLLHPCSRLKNKQAKPKKTGIIPSDFGLSQNEQRIVNKASYDKGHLTPNALLTFSPKAGKISNFIINVAPQDPFTNQGPWKSIETKVSCHLKKKTGLVITGICPDKKYETTTKLDVPSCFWKLVCYKEGSETIVVGFFGNNSVLNYKKINDNTDAHNQRKKDVHKLRSQGEIMWYLKGTKYLKEYATMWFDSKSTLKGKIPLGPNLALVDPISCATAQSLPEGIQPAWDTKRKKRDGSPVFGCTKQEEDEFISKFMIFQDNDSEDSDESSDNEDSDDVDDDDGDDGSTIPRFKSANCGKRLIGYYPSWGDSRFTKTQANALTHAIFAFFETFADGNVQIGSAESVKAQDRDKETDTATRRLKNFLNICSQYDHLKCLFAVGGWENSQYFSDIAANPSKRINFIASVLKIIDEYKFDGIDIDWEYPVTGGAVEGIAADKSNYVEFMKDLREAFDQHANRIGLNDRLLISFAGAAGQWTLDPGYDLKGLLKYADFANVMTYDYFGAWDSKWGAYTGPPSPLFYGNPKGFSGKVNADWSVKYYVCRTKEPHKINMGVPFYGRFWKNVGEPIDPNDGMWRLAEAVNGKFEGGFEGWKSIRDNYLNNPDFRIQFHDKSKSPFAWNAQTKIFLGFENPESLKHKVQYAEDFNLGGLMIWAIDQDDEKNSMLKVVNNADLCKITDPTKILHKCPPIEEKRWWTPEDGYDKAGMCGRSAPLYQGYYPVCDPDDPGYSCCGSQGYCGSGQEFCDCKTCVDYLKYPEKIIEDPIRPTTPVRWYLSTDVDGKRGRCGRNVPFLNEKAPICNPDDKNSHCCSNGGYCGASTEHCLCDGCIDFKKNPNYEFKPVKWWTFLDGADKAGRCGSNAPRYKGELAECDPDSNFYCCSKSGFCGSTQEHCNCDGCVNYRN